MPRPTFYTAFSNSMTEVIPNLSEEAMKISDLLQELAFNDKLYYIKDEIFNLDRLMLNFSKYGRRIDIFYFSGHSSDGCLQLTEGSLPSEQMSQIVNSSLKNAKLIIFNACETFKLAQQIIRSRRVDDEPFVVISCRGKINSFIAERFATLFFSQVGQPGTYRDAYDQAQAIIKAIHRDTRFREFDNIDDALNAGDDFDIGYIEIGPEDRITTSRTAAVRPASPPSVGASPAAPVSAAAPMPQPSEPSFADSEQGDEAESSQQQNKKSARSAASASEKSAEGEDSFEGIVKVEPPKPADSTSNQQEQPKTSIIDPDKLIRDALVTNYFHEVVNSLLSDSLELPVDQLELLKNALQAAMMIANGERKTKKVSELFEQAAQAVPGLSSGAAFDSLINAEKNMDKPGVRNLIKANHSEKSLKFLVDKISNVQSMNAQ